MRAVTIPMEYRQASADFDRFIVDARDIAALQTTNQAYTMVQAVLYTFRRRLDISGALRCGANEEGMALAARGIRTRMGRS